MLTNKIREEFINELKKIYKKCYKKEIYSIKDKIYLFNEYNEDDCKYFLNYAVPTVFSNGVYKLDIYNYLYEKHFSKFEATLRNKGDIKIKKYECLKSYSGIFCDASGSHFLKNQCVLVYLEVDLINYRFDKSCFNEMCKLFDKFNIISKKIGLNCFLRCYSKSSIINYINRINYCFDKLERFGI